MSPKFAFTPIPPARRESARRSSAVAGLSGEWHGYLTDETGAREAFALLRQATGDPSVAGRFVFFSTAAVAPTGVRLLDANDRAFVALVGPYRDPREGVEVVTVLEGVRSARTISGTWHTRLHNWRSTVRSGQFEATLSNPAHRAA
jgi:hypothetical protein